MSNTNLVIDMVTKEALRIAHEEATFTGTVNRTFDDSFGKEGAKIGSTLRIKLPNEYSVRTSGRVMDVQDTESAAVTLTQSSYYGVDLRFNSQELNQDIVELSKNYIRPAVQRLMSKIDSAAIETATKDIYNLVGTPGTVVGAVTTGFSDTTALGLARAKLNLGLAPKSDRSVQMDSVTMASTTNGSKNLFLPSATVEKAYLEGFIGRGQGADWYENERTYSHTVGSDVTVSTSSSSGATDGGTTITMNSTDGNVNAGDIFTIPKVFACHPETKRSTGQLQQFVCTAASTGAITVSPATYWTGAKQNVCTATSGTCTVADFDSEVMTFVGTANTAYRHNLMYNRDAFAFVTAALPTMADAISCKVQTQEGISLRVWQGSDIRNDELLLRIDMLYGYKTIRPAWACRITN